MYYIYHMERPLLQKALDGQRYELVAHILVYRLIKTKKDEQKKDPEKPKTRILQPGTR